MSRASAGSGLCRLLWNSPGGSISLQILAICRELESAEWRQGEALRAVPGGEGTPNTGHCNMGTYTRVPHHQLPTATRKPVSGSGEEEPAG